MPQPFSRPVKTTGVFAASLLIVTIAGSLLFALACNGDLRACYAILQESDSVARARKGALTQFAASPSAVVFPVVMSDKTTGLLFAERQSGIAKLIVEPNHGYWSPYLSQDGERLVFIRQRVGQQNREIVTCKIGEWRCRVLLRTEDNLRSPIEIERDSIIYASSPLLVGGDGKARYASYDFHHVRTGGVPTRLTDFRFYALHSVQVVQERIIFSAVSSRTVNAAIPRFNPSEPNRSEIYAVGFDREPKIPKPEKILDPLFVIGGYSINAAISANADLAVVQNSESGKGRYEFDLVVVSLNGTIQRRIRSQGLGFSPGAFVEGSILLNELFEDRYSVKRIKSPQGPIDEVLSVRNSAAELARFEKIRLIIDGQ